MTEPRDILMDIFRLSTLDRKPLLGRHVKLSEEVGELGEACLHQEGWLPHKTMKEPLVGEVADTIQCAIAVLAGATPDLTDEQRYELLLSELVRKNQKWESVIPRD